MNSGAAAALTLGGSAAGVTYAGVGNGSSISGGTLNLASSGSPSGSHTFSVARGQGSTDLNILANIADGSANGQTLVKTGNGILQLSGTNTFTGGTQIEAGTLALGSNNAIPAASSLTLSAGTLNLGGYANTAGTLVMQGGLITGNGSFAAASFNLQSGTLSGSLVGSGSLSKTTSGVVTITSSNSYSGGTTLSGGTLAVSADNNLGSTTGALTLDGGTLQVLGTSFTSTTRPVTTTSNGGGISVADPNNSLTLATQNLSGSGAFTKAGQGGLQLGGSIGSTAITVQDGSLQLTAGTSQLTGNPALSLWNVATFSFSNHNESVSDDQSHRGHDQYRHGHVEPGRQPELRPLDLAGDHRGQPVPGNLGRHVFRQSGKLDRLDGRGEHLRQSGRRPGENGQWTAHALRIEHLQRRHNH